MNPEVPSGLNTQLLDDFFAEADEHLLGIRQAVLQLEASVGRSRPDAKIVETLFLNIHSFKGIAAIVGLEPAAAAAHAIEDYLRLLREGKAELTAQGLEVLTASARKLEQAVAAFGTGSPLPDISTTLADLKQLCELSARVSLAASPEAGQSDAAGPTEIEQARAAGRLWKFTFSPSRELDAQGFNINSVREELSQSGNILKANPLVRGPGAIAFEFLVSVRETPSDIAAWAARGVVVCLAEDAEPEPALASPAAKPAAGEDEHNPFLAPSHYVRVDLKQLDELMRITGEMVIHRSRLDAQLARVTGGAGRVDLRGVQEVSAAVGRSLRELREAVMRVRLVPVAEIFARMPFVVRDLARESPKRVRLKLEGQDTAMDKYLIERLKDPLLHLVRNAFSHGVEASAERAAAGKPAQATITLKASSVGDSVIIQVQDDGQGVDANAIISRARKLGLEVPSTVDNEAILKILCAAGFSTREDADRASGRGVGMAVVYSTLRELGGSLALESEPGKGTQFTLRLPLTLAIAETLVISAAGQTCAVPQSFVREILHTTEAQIQIVNGLEAIPYRSGILPVVRLSGLFRLRGAVKPQMYLLVITSERGSVGLLAEEILGQREVVVSALRDPLIQVAGISGATELGDGRPVLILDGAALTSGNVRPLERLSPVGENN